MTLCGGTRSIMIGDLLGLFADCSRAAAPRPTSATHTLPRSDTSLVLVATSTSPATPSPSSAPSLLLPAQVLGQGILLLEGKGTTYDQDAVNVGWKSLTDQSWVTQKVTYTPTGNNGAPIIEVEGSPYTDVVLTGAGPRTSQNCANAPRGAMPSPTGPNAVTGASFKAGEGICVEMQDTSAKSDGRHLVLLVVKPVTSNAVTAAVTVGAQ
jgi:hypothetical protein